MQALRKSGNTISCGEVWPKICCYCGQP